MKLHRYNQLTSINPFIQIKRQIEVIQSMKMCELSTAINKYSFNIKYYFQNQILKQYRCASQGTKFPPNVSKISASFNIQASGSQTSMTKYEWRSNNYSPAQYKNTDRHIQIYSVKTVKYTHNSHIQSNSMEVPGKNKLH